MDGEGWVPLAESGPSEPDGASEKRARSETSGPSVPGGGPSREARRQPAEAPEPRERPRVRKERKERGAYLVDLVKRWMKEHQVRQRVDPASAFSMWREVVGDEIADHTRVVDAANGELVVEVDSAPLLNELSTYYRQEILESLKEHEEFRGIQKLRFRSGSF